MEGEIDIVDETPKAENDDKSLTSSTRNTGNRDRRVMEALFNGDAITGVYDHNYFESSWNISDNSQTAGSANNVDAARYVDEIMKRMSNRGPVPLPKYGQSSGTISGPSSSSLLSNLRALNTDISEETAPPAFYGVSDIATSSGILKDLKTMFELPGSAYTTQEIVFHFGDLADDVAPIFREMLRRVAKFKEGVWSRNKDFTL